MHRTMRAARLGLALAALGTAPLSGPARAQGDPAAEKTARPVPPPADLPAGVPALDEAKKSFRAGRHDEALETLRGAVAKAPGLPPARVLLALMHFSANQPAQARASLEKAADESPEDPEIYALLGKLALGDGRPTEAALDFDKALALGAPRAWSAEKARALKVACLDGLAAVAEARSRWPEATDRLAALLEIDPRNAAARQRLARALFSRGQPAEAAKELERASADDPKAEPAGVVMARLYLQARDFKKAEEWLDYAVKKAPTDPRPQLARANFLLDRGRAEEAVPPADALARSAPNSADARRIRGLIALQTKDFAGAERQFQALVQESPGDLFAGTQLVMALAGQEDEAKRKRALELARVNARQAPKSPAVLAALGWSLFRLGELDQAERTLRDSAPNGATTPDGAYFLARVLAARGKAEEARKLARTALDAQGPFLSRREAQAWLDAEARTSR